MASALIAAREARVDKVNRIVLLLLDVIKGLMAIIDEKNLLIQRMLAQIRKEAEDESDRHTN